MPSYSMIKQELIRSSLFDDFRYNERSAVFDAVLEHCKGDPLRSKAILQIMDTMAGLRSFHSDKAFSWRLEALEPTIRQAEHALDHNPDVVKLRDHVAAQRQHPTPRGIG